MAKVANRKNIYIRDEDQKLLERFERDGGNASDLFSRALRRYFELKDQQTLLLTEFISNENPHLRWTAIAVEGGNIHAIASLESSHFPRPLDKYYICKSLEVAAEEGVPMDVVEAATAAMEAAA